MVFWSTALFSIWYRYVRINLISHSLVKVNHARKYLIFSLVILCRCTLNESAPCFRSASASPGDSSWTFSPSNNKDHEYCLQLSLRSKTHWTQRLGFVAGLCCFVLSSLDLRRKHAVLRTVDHLFKRQDCRYLATTSTKCNYSASIAIYTLR